MTKTFEQFLAENPYRLTRSFTEDEWNDSMYERWKDECSVPTEVLGKDNSEGFTPGELGLQPYSRTPFEKLLVDGEKNIGTLDFRDCADVDIAKKYFSLLSQAKNMYFMLKKIAPIISTLINRTPTGEERNELTDTNTQMLTILNNCKPKP
jgi:hypothetical protein